MLTKTKNIHKQSNIFFFQKFKKHLSIWTKGSNIQNLKEIRALGSEKIAARTDGQGMTDKTPIPWPLLTESSRAKNWQSSRAKNCKKKYKLGKTNGQKENALEMWWIGSYLSQNLAILHNLTISEKTGLMDRYLQADNSYSSAVQ